MEGFVKFNGKDKGAYFHKVGGGKTLSPLRRNYEDNPLVGDGLRNVIVKRDIENKSYTPHYFAWLVYSNKMPVVGDREIGDWEFGKEGIFFEKVGGRIDKESFYYSFNPSQYTGVIESSPAYLINPKHGVYGFLANTLFMSTDPGLVDGDELDVENECPSCECAYTKSKAPVSLEVFEVTRGGCVVQTSIPVYHIGEQLTSYIKEVNFSLSDTVYHPHHPVEGDALSDPLSLGYQYDPNNGLLFFIRNYHTKYDSGYLRLLGLRLSFFNRYKYPVECVRATGVFNPDSIVSSWNIGDIVCEQFDESMDLAELNFSRSELVFRFDLTKNEIESIPFIEEDNYPKKYVVIVPNDCERTEHGIVKYRFRLVTAPLSPLTYRGGLEEVGGELVNHPPPTHISPVGLGIRKEDKKCSLVSLSDKNRIMTTQPQQPTPSPSPTPPIDHSYDYIVLLRWENSTDTDLDLHAFINGNAAKHVYYGRTEHQDDDGRMWLDYDYTKHGPNGREEEPEIITILGFREAKISIRVVNYNGGELTEEVEVSIYRSDGTNVRNYMIDPQRLVGRRKAFYVCDFIVGTEQCIDKMTEIG